MLQKARVIKMSDQNAFHSFIVRWWHRLLSWPFDRARLTTLVWQRIDGISLLVCGDISPQTGDYTSATWHDFGV